MKSCLRCGNDVDAVDSQTSHIIALHYALCDGNCASYGCPLEVECGPLIPVRLDIEKFLLSMTAAYPEVANQSHTCNLCGTACENLFAYGLHRYDEHPELVSSLEKI